MKNYLIISFIVILIILTSLVKSSTRDLEAEIFTSKEEIKLLSDKKDLILLENNFLSSPGRLFELKELFFEKELISLKLNKFINIYNHEK